MNSTIAAPHSRTEEKVMLEQAIAASLGEPVDEQALLTARRQAAVRNVGLHQATATSSRAHLTAMKRPRGVFC